jgi:hypothetical protein
MRKGHHVKDWQLAQRDPDLYVLTRILPALLRHGYDSESKIAAEVPRLFRNRNAQEFVIQTITKAQNFAAREKKFQAAPGMNAGSIYAKDPFVALNTLTTSLGNLGATLTSPLMESAARRMNIIAGGFARWAAALAAFDRAHPLAAKTLGTGALVGGGVVGSALTYGLISNLMGGFGLRGSAVALNESAAALTAAAGKLGAAGVADGLGAPGGSSPRARLRFRPGLAAGGLSSLASLMYGDLTMSPAQRADAYGIHVAPKSGGESPNADFLMRGADAVRRHLFASPDEAKRAGQEVGKSFVAAVEQEVSGLTSRLKNALSFTVHPTVAPTVRGLDVHGVHADTGVP